MFFINDFSDRDFAVKFFHNMRPSEGRPFTECQILSTPKGSLFTKDTPDVSIVAKGVSRVDSRDNYSRPKGRKTAFAKAVKELPRELRPPFWVAYFEHHNDVDSPTFIDEPLFNSNIPGYRIKDYTNK